MNPNELLSPMNLTQERELDPFSVWSDDRKSGNVDRTHLEGK
jgi:hypothetical protein